MQNASMTSSRFRHRHGSGLSAALVASVSLAGLVLEGPAMAADAYAGKTLTVAIASKPGGGTDTAGRLFARFWGDHIPGKPQVLVRNKPQQIIAANELQHSTRPDGLVVTVFAGGGSLGPVARGSKAVRYDPTSWGYVGSIERGPSIQLIRKTAYPRLLDPKAQPVAMGTVGADRTQDAIAVFGAEYLGWNIKFVLGYPNSSAIYLAFGRGEVDMFGSGTTSIIERFINKEGAMPLVAQTSRPDFPNVKTFNEMIGDKKPTGDKWRAFTAWTGPSAVDKYFALPPKTPENLLNVLRASFKATSESAAFKKDAQNILGEGYSILSGPETLELVEGAIKVTPGVVAEIDRLRTKYGLPKVQREAPKAVKVKLQEIVREGRAIKFNANGKPMQVSVSGSRSEITVGGKPSGRSALKAGMTCEVSWADSAGKQEARKIACN